MPNQNYPSIQELRIKTDVLSTDAVVKLSSIVWFTQSDGTAVSLTSADFGTSGTAYGVFEPRTSRQEFFSWSPSTIANGTTTGITITARGLPWGSDYTTQSNNRKFAHPAGSKILLFTDYGAFWAQFCNKANTETITEAWTFSSTPVITNVPTLSTQAANKAYVDGVAVAGGPDASTTIKGLVEIATGAELAAGTGTGGTGAVVVAAGSSFKNSSAGAGDANKVPVLNASGVLDTSFLPDPLSRTADQLQITTDPDSSNDAVRKAYLDSVFGSSFFGNGSDGAVTMDGTNTFASFASKSGSNYTLTRDVFVTTLELTSVSTLDTAGFRIYATTSVTVNNGTTLFRRAGVGSNGSGGTGGSGGTTTGGTTPNGGAGASGANAGPATAGGNATNQTDTVGSAGGNGGGSGSAAGGTGATATAYGGAFQAAWPFEALLNTATASALKGGGGGGGGGSGTGGAINAGGGGGGAGGGVLWVSSKTITINSGGVAHADGGAGGNGSTASNSGGGGGGGGGKVFFRYSSYTNNGTVRANGGAGGLKNTSGVDGVAGTNSLPAAITLQV